MIYESPRWLRVLCAWQSNPDRMAPTIPFVIGAMREPVGVSVTRHRSIEEEIRVLLESIRDEMPEAKHVLVKLCGTINEWVVYLSNGDTPAGHATGFDNEVQRRKTLFVDSAAGSHDPSETLDSVVEFLAEQYRGHVMEGRFSKNGGVWEAYTAEERELLAQYGVA